MEQLTLLVVVYILSLLVLPYLAGKVVMRIYNSPSTILITYGYGVLVLGLLNISLFILFCIWNIFPTVTGT